MHFKECESGITVRIELWMDLVNVSRGLLNWHKTYIYFSAIIKENESVTVKCKKRMHHQTLDGVMTSPTTLHNLFSLVMALT